MLRLDPDQDTDDYRLEYGSGRIQAEVQFGVVGLREGLGGGDSKDHGGDHGVHMDGETDQFLSGQRWTQFDFWGCQDRRTGGDDIRE